MVQQTLDSKISEYGMGNSETDLPTGDKQLPVAIKKTVLRDLQNNNKITVPNSNGNSSQLKDIGPITNTTKLSGTKRASSPECSDSPSQRHSPNNNNSPNGHLVYVRRKSETELGKSSTCDSTNMNTNCPNSTQPGQQQETIKLISQIKEPKVSCYPATAPFPASSSLIPSRKPTVPPLGKAGMRLASAESNHHPIASTTAAEPNHDPRASAAPTLDNLKALRNLHWEDRYRRLQLLLKKLDQSQQEEYVKMLRSLSSVELSRHAVELEKRSIQLSLEEAKELQRVGVLNVLGKPLKPTVLPSTYQDRTEK